MANSPLQRRLLALPDGRELEVHLAGPTDGVALVFHHGTPGSSFAPRHLIDAATSRGFRLVAPSRSGYAGSSRDPDRAISAVVGDTEVMLDALGIDGFVTAGWSGGGPHALACAARLPERCAAAASICGVAPYLPDEFDWTAGMAAENVHEFAMTLEAGPAYDELLAGYREFFLALTPDQVTSPRDLLGDLVSERDTAATTPEALAFLLENFSTALAPGYGGWRDDDQAFVKPWGFDVASIDVPVAIWFGDHDLSVPASHGEWLSVNVSGAERHRLTGEGHLSFMVERLGDVFDDLWKQAKLPW
jgi:pimeloyl-ACP methyl ester carboxylesterase